MPLVVMLMSMDAPKVLDVSSKGMDLETVVWITGSLQNSSLSRMRLGRGIGMTGVVGVSGVRVMGKSIF